MTIGKRTAACSDKLGIERTVVVPIPNSTALAIMNNSIDIENLVDIWFRPCPPGILGAQLMNADIATMFRGELSLGYGCFRVDRYA
jgi:hypothetical protein